MHYNCRRKLNISNYLIIVPTPPWVTVNGQFSGQSSCLIHSPNKDLSNQSKHVCFLSMSGRENWLKVEIYLRTFISCETVFLVFLVPKKSEIFMEIRYRTILFHQMKKFADYKLKFKVKS